MGKSFQGKKPSSEIINLTTKKKIFNFYTAKSTLEQTNTNGQLFLKYSTNDK